MNILDKIQNSLCELYQIKPAHQVSRFYIPYQLENPSDHIGSPKCKETLFVSYNGDDIELGLFISPLVMERLRNTNPFIHLNQKCFSDFCLAIEGVSHFLYLTYKAEQEKSVTQLELELQAEVDRFVLLALLYKNQLGILPPNLRKRLFDNVKLLKHLSPELQKRYTIANHLAAKFCTHLEEAYIRPWRLHKFLGVIRGFYKQNHWEKISHLTP